VITPPRRAVTRFFVPFIDVLILLFGIFLLMPFVSGPPAPEAADAKPEAPKAQLPEDVRELQRRLTEANDRLLRMERSAQARLTDRWWCGCCTPTARTARCTTSTPTGRRFAPRRTPSG
jgi:hypothetical protein